MKVKINITPQDMEQGEPWSDINCPAALALARSTGREVSVGYGRIEIDGIGFFKIPKAVAEFVRKFDLYEDNYRNIYTINKEFNLFKY